MLRISGEVMKSQCFLADTCSVRPLFCRCLELLQVPGCCRFLCSVNGCGGYEHGINQCPKKAGFCRSRIARYSTEMASQCLVFTASGNTKPVFNGW